MGHALDGVKAAGGRINQQSKTKPERDLPASAKLSARTGGESEARLQRGVGRRHQGLESAIAPIRCGAQDGSGAPATVLLTAVTSWAATGFVPDPLSRRDE